MISIVAVGYQVESIKLWLQLMPTSALRSWDVVIVVNDVLNQLSYYDVAVVSLWDRAISHRRTRVSTVSVLKRNTRN